MRLRTQLMVSLLATLAIAGIATGCALYYLFPNHWVRWYPIVPAFFMVLAIVMTLKMNDNTIEPKKMILSFMALRVVKFMLTLVALLLYYLLVGEMMTQVALLTFGFYVLYLVVETIVLYCFEKSNKQRSKNDA